MNILIRADASAQIGTGHIMRCLALAQAWQDQGGRAIFVLSNKSPALEARLLSEQMLILHLSVEVGSDEDAHQTVDFAYQFAPKWVVVDGYHFGAEYQKAIKDFGNSLLFFDDYGHSNCYYSDLVLNQNISAHQDLYINREPYTKLLLGTDYTLLRKEFCQWLQWHRKINLVASKILVTLGGSDPDNVTLKVIQALQLVNSDNLEVIVVVGGSNPHYEKLQAEVAKSRILITLQQNVTNMPELMAWADIAIAAGGSTNWELAFMGLPSLVITVADNQKDITAKLDRQGVIINLGWHQNVTIEGLSLAIQDLIGDRPHRETMSKKGQQLVDGNGAKRVVSAMVSMLA
ncbi:UDP-2,4-diacetamido-2,4,6-trideoxy-beta-L-altropyranose hydrolase [Anabaena sp. AL93]|jgi:UDP-2,4-diacetamido-2,4,6-trideoxy-beta-L-altropyranose hydrolase|uniref:UDP-2,4-diacetamido-2,4, 6-trideoxy-beta-L-altropyranose hydrolase n=1 Tax=Anabaena sp. AL93 TaxID=1678133 RepID=UPI00080026E8|nr:UDP-2,4-diacetamido-2,4,6-trideoxy-beta-L-altropyranose hydrolase [Anabaena sp. AL93]OBQ20687.1 MAG: UDP-2,4-diacetamido-2,4,6-trideoxy-beta-L-altropyranose hydrolase [Anabaena sp. AL93]